MWPGPLRICVLSAIWHVLRDIDATEPSHIVYPEFDHLLKVSMIRETELFFEEVLKNDLSLTNFVASDFTMLNGRLAKHYGIPGIDVTNKYKLIAYDYDLISNKVNGVDYQRGSPDAFFHRYQYDAENRLVQPRCNRSWALASDVRA